MIDQLGEEGFMTAYTHYSNTLKQNPELELFPPISIQSTHHWTSTFTHLRLFSEKEPGHYSVYYQPTGGHLPLDKLSAILNLLYAMPHVQVRLNNIKALPPYLILLHCTRKRSGYEIIT